MRFSFFSKFTFMPWMSALLLCALLTLLHYHHAAQFWQTRAQNATNALAQAHITLEKHQQQQKTLTQLDEKHTQELLDARDTIARLEHDVATGVKRLRVHARCPNISPTIATSGVDDASTPRLAHTAERDYFTLLERVTFMQKQLEALQDYVRKMTEGEGQ